MGNRSKKNPDGIDVATSTEEIEPLSRFIGRLNELTGEAVSPIVDGVKHRPLPTSNDRGFAISIIPESESGPHMAKLGENRYYKRSGDSFYRMEHFDIEDMFGKRRKPKLELYAFVKGQKNLTNIVIGIKNNGRGTAKAPYLAFSAPEPFVLSIYGVDGNGNEGLPRLFVDEVDLKHKKHRFGGSPDFVIHPNTTLLVASLFLEIPTLPSINLPQSVTIDYTIAAEDCRMLEGALEVNLNASNPKT